MTPLVEVIEIVRMEQDFSHFAWTSAWVDFGHVLGNDIQDTDRISFQIKTVCFQINSIRFRVCIMHLSMLSHQGGEAGHRWGI